MTHYLKHAAFMSAICLLPSVSSFANERCVEQSDQPCLSVKNTVVKENHENEILIESIYRNKITNTVWENLAASDDFYQSPYQISLFDAKNGEDSERLWSQTKSIFGFGFGVIGVLYIMPTSVTNWDKDSGDFIKWGSNVKEGPLWDRDNVPINLIGHPYFGSVYYQVARKSGYRQWDAFVYSFLMSTFYWEYGIEAIAEIPSVQDLVITPVLGWAWGEWAFNQEQDLRNSGGTIWGSDFLGSTALVLLDPIDSAGRGINNLFGHQVIKAGSGYISMNERPVNRGHNGTDETESYVQLNMTFTFGSGERGTNAKPVYYKYSKDPIDYGVVGISFGTGYVEPDDEWDISGDQVTLYSLGLYFSRSFSSRVTYSKGKFTEAASGKGLHYENYSLDSQYYFNTENSLRPFITAGFGEVLRDRDNEQKVFEVNAGVGLHYKITNNLAIQTDIRRFHSTRADKSESAMSLQAVYRFGKGEWY